MKRKKLFSLGAEGSVYIGLLGSITGSSTLPKVRPFGSTGLAINCVDSAGLGFSYVDSAGLAINYVGSVGLALNCVGSRATVLQALTQQCCRL